MFEKNRFWIENEGQKAIGLSANGRSKLIDELDAAEKRIAELKDENVQLKKDLQLIRERKFDLIAHDRAVRKIEKIKEILE